jgi:hypothetical protein
MENSVVTTVASNADNLMEGDTVTSTAVSVSLASSEGAAAIVTSAQGAGAEVITVFSTSGGKTHTREVESSISNSLINVNRAQWERYQESLRKGQEGLPKKSLVEPGEYYSYRQDPMYSSLFHPNARMEEGVKLNPTQKAIQRRMDEMEELDERTLRRVEMESRESRARELKLREKQDEEERGRISVLERIHRIENEIKDKREELQSFRNFPIKEKVDEESLSNRLKKLENDISDLNVKGDPMGKKMQNELEDYLRSYYLRMNIKDRFGVYSAMGEQERGDKTHQYRGQIGRREASRASPLEDQRETPQDPSAFNQRDEYRNSARPPMLGEFRGFSENRFMNSTPSLVQIFSDDNTYRIEKFLQDIESLCIEQKYPMSYRKIIADARIRGSAQELYNDLRISDLTDWDDYKQALLDCFSHVDDPSSINNEIASCHQHQAEGARKYGLRMYALFHRKIKTYPEYLQDATKRVMQIDMKGAFLAGLKSTPLKIAMRPLMNEFDYMAFIRKTEVEECARSHLERRGNVRVMNYVNNEQSNNLDMLPRSKNGINLINCEIQGGNNGDEFQELSQINQIQDAGRPVQNALVQINPNLQNQLALAQPVQPPQPILFPIPIDKPQIGQGQGYPMFAPGANPVMMGPIQMDNQMFRGNGFYNNQQNQYPGGGQQNQRAYNPNYQNNRGQGNRSRYRQGEQPARFNNPQRSERMLAKPGCTCDVCRRQNQYQPSMFRNVTCYQCKNIGHYKSDCPHGVNSQNNAPMEERGGQVNQSQGRPQRVNQMAQPRNSDGMGNVSHHLTPIGVEPDLVNNNASWG